MNVEVNFEGGREHTQREGRRGARPGSNADGWKQREFSTLPCLNLFLRQAPKGILLTSEKSTR